MRVGIREAHLATPGTGPCEHDLRVEFAIGIESAAGLAISLETLPLLETLGRRSTRGRSFPRILAQSILEINTWSLFANVAVPERSGECECIFVRLSTSFCCRGTCIYHRRCSRLCFSSNTSCDHLCSTCRRPIYSFGRRPPRIPIAH